jgi:hypothetical protein
MIKNIYEWNLIKIILKKKYELKSNNIKYDS